MPGYSRLKLHPLSHNVEVLFSFATWHSCCLVISTESYHSVLDGVIVIFRDVCSSVDRSRDVL